MLLVSEPWSSKEVGKLVALIASEHIYTRTMLDMLPVGMAVLSQSRFITWSNQQFRSLSSALTEQELQQTLEHALQTSPFEVRAGDKQLSIRVAQSPALPGMALVVAEHIEITPATDRTYATLGAGLEMLNLCEAPLLVYDDAGSILFANTQARRLAGQETSELTTVAADELFPCQHALLRTAGECRLTLRRLTAPTTEVRASVNPFRASDGREAFCLTILNDRESWQRMLNVAALEGCLVAAFPSSSVTRTMLAGSERFGVRSNSDDPERFLTVTHAALRSDRFREYLNQVPEALNVTTEVSLTEHGVSAMP